MISDFREVTIMFLAILPGNALLCLEMHQKILSVYMIGALIVLAVEVQVIYLYNRNFEKYKRAAIQTYGDGSPSNKILV